MSRGVILNIRRHRHLSRMGWVLWVNGEAVAWYRELLEAVQDARLLAAVPQAMIPQIAAFTSALAASRQP